MYIFENVWKMQRDFMVRLLHLVCWPFGKKLPSAAEVSGRPWPPFRSIGR
jgi:hypothetical protein